MKNSYNYYSSKKEKLITKKKQDLSKIFNNARNINTAVAESYDKERNIFNELIKTLTAVGLGNFFRDFQIALDLDKNITEKIAFERLLFEHEDIEEKVGILAEFYASKKNHRIYRRSSRNRNRKFRKEIFDSNMEWE